MKYLPGQSTDTGDVEEAVGRFLDFFFDEPAIASAIEVLVLGEFDVLGFFFAGEFEGEVSEPLSKRNPGMFLLLMISLMSEELS